MSYRKLGLPLVGVLAAVVTLLVTQKRSPRVAVVPSPVPAEPIPVPAGPTPSLQDDWYAAGGGAANSGYHRRGPSLPFRVDVLPMGGSPDGMMLACGDTLYVLEGSRILAYGVPPATHARWNPRWTYPILVGDSYGTWNQCAVATPTGLVGTFQVSSSSWVTRVLGIGKADGKVQFQWPRDSDLGRVSPVAPGIDGTVVVTWTHTTPPVNTREPYIGAMDDIVLLDSRVGVERWRLNIAAIKLDGRELGMDQNAIGWGVIPGTGGRLFNCSEFGNLIINAGNPSDWIATARYAPGGWNARLGARRIYRSGIANLLGDQSDWKEVVAFDDANKVLWTTRKLGTSRYKPRVVLPGLVIVEGGEQLIGLDDKNGRVLWRRSLHLRDKILVPPPHTSWEGPAFECGDWAHPCLAAGRLLFTTESSNGSDRLDSLVAFSPRNGRRLWSRRFPYRLRTMIAHRGIIYLLAQTVDEKSSLMIRVMRKG